MSGNPHDKMNESIDGFNLSKEEFMNCFGSQISSQSSKSNYEYQNEYNNNSDKKKNSAQNQIQIQQQGRDLSENQNNSKSNGNIINKDDILRNICHGFIDMFFSQKEELKEIKEEIKKLQNIMINNSNNNKKSMTKKIKINNQKSLIYHQNNNINNNENFNYSLKNSKKNTFLNNSNNPFIEEQNNQLNQPKKDIKKEQKKNFMPILANTKLSRGKSPNIHLNPKSSIPETVLEVDEEYELTATHKQKREKERNNTPKKEFYDPFLSENPEENNNFKFEDVTDDEFDAVLKGGKKNGNIQNNLLINDPFKKSSELKIKPDKNLENKDINNDTNNININNNNEKNMININDNNNNYVRNINYDSDEIVSDFMVGNKKISIKLNDDIRKKINSFDEPINKLEELDKNKEPSNIIHKTSKLSCTSVMSKAKNILGNNINENNTSKIKEISSKIKIGKRNYNTMIEDSKIIIEKEKEKENLKDEDEKKNGSSVKERGGFRKKLKKFGNVNDYNYNNSIEINKIKNNSNPNSNNTTQNNISLKKIKKKIKNKKYMYTTISSCQFYCICTKSYYKKDNIKCKICKDNTIITIKNFKQGFYYYILYLQDNKEESKNNLNIDISDSTFNLLSLNNISEKDSNFNQFKELEQFFNYQFILLTYDKYLKLSQKNSSNNELIENLIEEIYNKLIPKYIEIYVKGKRSFLTEVCEGDSTLGHMNILLFLMNINNNSDNLNGEKTIEFSDGYKSCYAVINNSDPINKLMNQIILHNWMNVEIGMSKILNISSDFKIYIKIYYNSISPSEITDNNNNDNINYGPLLEKKFLPKNILEINNDGGEISLINVIIAKKYDFYVHNVTKKIRYSRKKFENEMMKIPDSDRKNYSDSEGKNNDNNKNEVKEPDIIFFHFKVIAMDYEIYNILKKNSINNNKNVFDHFLKKKYIIDFNIKYQAIYDNIIEGKMYQLMFLNLEHKNRDSISSTNQNVNYNLNYFFNNNNKDNDIQIKFGDKSQINELQLNLNYKNEKEYIETNELINKNLNLTNNIDIGKLFIENNEDNKEKINNDYLNKEFFISGIYNGYIDKIRNNLSSEVNNEEKNGNEVISDEYIERYIFLSIGISKIAILKLHKEDFFNIDVKSNTIKDKIFNINDVLYKEILYFDNDNNQPKITGRKKLENSIPILSLETNNYTSINFGNYTKNKEQIDLFLKYKESNKKLVDMLNEAIG